MPQLDKLLALFDQPATILCSGVLLLATAFICKRFWKRDAATTSTKDPVAPETELEVIREYVENPDLFEQHMDSLEAEFADRLFESAKSELVGLLEAHMQTTHLQLSPIWPSVRHLAENVWYLTRPSESQIGLMIHLKNQLSVDSEQLQYNSIWQDFLEFSKDFKWVRLDYAISSESSSEGKVGEVHCLWLIRFQPLNESESGFVNPGRTLIGKTDANKRNIKAKGCGQEANRIGSIAAQKGSSQGIIPALERARKSGRSEALTTKVLAVAFVEPIMRDQELFKNDQQWQKQSPTLDRSYMCSAMRRVVRERRISYRVGPALFRCLQFLWEPHHLKPLYPHNEKPSFSKASLHQRLSRMPSIDKESPEKNKRLFFHSIPVDAGEEVSATPVTESDLVESAGIGLAFKGSAGLKAATREINLLARNVGNSLAKASSIDGPKPDDLPGAENSAASSDLLVSAFLLVNGWAKAPSVSEKTTYFKVSSQAFKSKKVAIRRKLPSFFLHRQRSDKKMLMPLTQIQDGKWLMTTLSRRTNSSQQVFPIGLPCRNWIKVGLYWPSAAPSARARRRKLSADAFIRGVTGFSKPCFASQTRVWTVYFIASTNATNGEQRAPSSFAYALTRTPSLNDIPSRSSFLYSDRVIAYSDDYWFRNKSSNQMPSAAGCSTKVSGDTYAQRLSGSEGDGAYSNEGLSHTDLPTSGAYIPSSRPAVF
ncbi:hypothetical protein EZV62_028281 [Acer yangbiense]|uniref:Uncharacterized protein n=1 Tax=Acer yangbiense TaxID=1000413 RepID=A0A5C7GNY1_9ROSI|nr:hypothetical protein EZV62_028281 [Acer yangbiense]